MVNDKQLTICRHVDDLKASYEEIEVIDEFVQWIKDKYEDEEITKVKVTCGKKHDYLGMNLDYSKPGDVKIEMIDYVQKMIEEFPYGKETGVNKSKHLQLNIHLRQEMIVLKHQKKS